MAGSLVADASIQASHPVITDGLLDMSRRRVKMLRPDKHNNQADPDRALQCLQSSSNPDWVSLSVAEGGINPESSSDDPTPSTDAAAAAASVAAASPRSLDDAPVSVNAVGIGLKVANEIMGLHTQAAAAGRALAYSNRQMELLQEENQALKVGRGYLVDLTAGKQVLYAHSCSTTANFGTSQHASTFDKAAVQLWHVPSVSMFRFAALTHLYLKSTGPQCERASECLSL